VALDLYETDFAEWAFHNADLLRSGKLTEADIANIAEEIDSLGRSQAHELESRITQIMEHLLKLRFAPEEIRERKRRAWRASVERQRGEIEMLLKSSPSLKRRITADLLRNCYSHAARTFALGFEVAPPRAVSVHGNGNTGGLMRRHSGQFQTS